MVRSWNELDSRTQTKGLALEAFRSVDKEVG